MKGAVIYARYSSEKQNDQSIEGQLRICNKYADDNGLTVLDTYIDRATTGTNDQRAAFQQMLSDCAKPVPWDIVLVYAIDRFGRNSIEIAVNKQKLKKNHKTLISATQRTSENIDGTKNLDGILLENVYIGIAEYYSAELSQKVTRGMYENRKKGLFCGGKIPFGYRVENKKVIVQEDEAEIVRFIFKEYAEGKIAREIIDELAEKGILVNGKPMPSTTFYKILNREKYIGINRHGDEVYTNLYPPIVPEPLFNQVRDILVKNKIGSFSRKADFMLKGKLICGNCGCRINGESGTSRVSKQVYYYYKCAAKKKRTTACTKAPIAKDNLENLVVNATFSLIGNSENVSLIADAVMQAHSKRLRDRSILNLLISEREGVKKSLANVMKAIEQGILTATTKNRMEELETELSQYDDKIALEEYYMQNQISREQVVQYLTHTIQQKAELVINTLVNRIVLYDDRVEIHYNYTERRPDGTPPDEGRGKQIKLNSTFLPNCAPQKRTGIACPFLWWNFQFVANPVVTRLAFAKQK